MSSAVAAGHSPAPSATSAPTTPLRSSSRIRFDSAKKRDPNNVYSEACATADLDDEDGPVGLEVSDSGDEDHPPSDSSTPEEVPSPSVAAPPAKRQKVLPASIRGGARKPALRTKHLAKTTSGDQVLVDKIGADGFLEDVTAAISVELTTRKPKVTEKTSDIRAFFTDPFFPSGSNKAKRKCKKCKADLVDEHSTLRRHCEAYHEHEYLQWCKKHDFVPHLPGIKKRDSTRSVQQPMSNYAVKVVKPIPYSDDVFQAAAIEWLLVTDQPLDAFEHPKFKSMLEIASRSKGDAKLPGQKAVRKEIIQQFNDHLLALRQLFNSPQVPGRVSATCDCWLTISDDAYFAVTLHWIQEVLQNQFELKNDIGAFIHLPYSHTGYRLGQALYRAFMRVHAQKKIGWVTSDNARNNDTMMKTLATLVNQNLGPEQRAYDASDERIRCLEHIIHLGVQALIKARSPGAFYDASNPEHPLPDTAAPRDGSPRDEIGIIRAISVKVRSSSKRKQTWLAIQERANPSVRAKMLKNDSPTRWGSTESMVSRAYSLREYIPPFLRSLAHDLEKEKKWAEADKILQLILTDEEWQHVEQFLGLLNIANTAQHTFSAEKYPTMHQVLPAIEWLIQQWNKCLKDPVYRGFENSIEHALLKMEDYHRELRSQPAYIVSMVLNPRVKFKFIKKNWSDDDAAEAERTMKNIFRERFLELAKRAPAEHPPTAPSSSRKRAFCISDSEDSDADGPESSLQPWEREYTRYVNTKHELAKNSSAINWWGLQRATYPTWASLAFDYLPIMSSSVSSERSFSSGGGTVTKKRNRLKADVVEASQVMKHAVRGGASLFRTTAADLDDDDDDNSSDEEELDDLDNLIVDLAIPFDDDKE